MPTIQHNESINALFDRYVYLKMSLKQSAKQYEQALRNEAENEFRVDFKLYLQ